MGAGGMTFQAYLDTIKAKTGKTPEDFLTLAEEKGLLQDGVKTGQIVAWLADDFGLGRGHAMALVETCNSATQPKQTRDQCIDRLFSGNRARWRTPYDELLGKITACGPGVAQAPTDTYISILRRAKKFAIVQVTAARLDIGIKLKGVEPTSRLEPAGSWNSMVTHRVRITDPSQLDGELLSWLKQAFDNAWQPKATSTAEVIYRVRPAP
jgi:predicted transport protein